jgi:hypothetical protein
MINTLSVDGAQQICSSGQATLPMAKFSAYNTFGSNGLPVGNVSSFDGAQQVFAVRQVVPPLAKFSALNTFCSSSLNELCVWDAS